MSEKCRVKYQLYVWNGSTVASVEKECPRIAVKDGYCACHLDDPNKSLDKLTHDIEEQSGNNVVDCSYFVFPKIPFTYPNAIRKLTYFQGAKFYGDVSFQGQDFTQDASFRGAAFHGKTYFCYKDNNQGSQTRFSSHADFTEARFLGEVKFDAVSFKLPPIFNNVVFNDKISFKHSELAFNDLWLAFEEVALLGEADLRFKLKGKIGGIAFRFCDLRGLIVSSLPRHETTIEFEEIKNWHASRSWYSFKRAKIQDEQTLKDNPVKLVDTYRFLEDYFSKHSDYSLASHFHVGAMIALRKQKNYPKAADVLSWLYQLTSNFGESLLRPLIALAATWIAFPLLLLFLGMPVTRVVDGKETVVTANWDFADLSQATFWDNGWADYRSALGSTISLSTIDRKHELSPPSDSLQKVFLIGETALNVVFGSLLIVAARRKFTPKKPIGN